MQQEIDEMYNGNVDAIVAGVQSENDYLIMNAILSGAQQGIKNGGFLAGIKKACDSESVLLGIPLKSVAEAAYCFLTEESYLGNDRIVTTLLENHFRL